MQLDPVKAADTRAWIEKALMDIRSASVDLDAVPPKEEADAALEFVHSVIVAARERVPAEAWPADAE